MRVEAEHDMLADEATDIAKVRHALAEETTRMLGRIANDLPVAAGVAEAIESASQALVALETSHAQGEHRLARRQFKEHITKPCGDPRCQLHGGMVAEGGGKPS